jgi:hypothetical protein
LTTCCLQPAYLSCRCRRRPPVWHWRCVYPGCLHRGLHRLSSTRASSRSACSSPLICGAIRWANKP